MEFSVYQDHLKAAEREREEERADVSKLTDRGGRGGSLSDILGVAEK